MTRISKDILIGPRLKSDRGLEHIKNIESFEKELPTNFYDLSVSLKQFKQNYPFLPPDYKIERFCLSYKPTKLIPEIFALIIGDAINNLRSALDYLASAIIRTQNPEAKPYFPYPTQTRKDKIPRTIDQMDAVLPGTYDLFCENFRINDNQIRIIEEIVKLNNDDKHNSVIPNISTVSIEEININQDGLNIKNLGVMENAACEFDLICSNTPIKLTSEPKIIVRVVFADGDFLLGAPVTEKLLEFYSIVQTIICHFGKLIESSNR